VVKLTGVLFTAFLLQTKLVSVFPNILGNQMSTKGVFKMRAVHVWTRSFVVLI